MERLLNKVIVRSFYRRNAGFFLFFFLLFFGVVAPSQQPAYHYALIRGMLEAPVFLGLVGCAWLLYALKCHRFVMDLLSSPEHAFLARLAELDRGRLYGLCLRVQAGLYWPVSLYSLIVSGVAVSRGRYGAAAGVLLFVMLVCGVSAGVYYYRLRHPGERNTGLKKAGVRPEGLKQAGVRKAEPYWCWLFRYLFHDQKLLLGGIKIFGCCLLYLLLKDQGPGDYDLRMPFLFYSLALLGHSLLIYRCRELEEKRLSFYRALPVSGMRRWAQYYLFYAVVLLPEMLTLGWLTPHPVRFVDSLGMWLSGYSMLLLLNSLLCVVHWKVSDFLKLSGGIFGILYFAVLGGMLIALSGCFFVTAFVLFYYGYYRYEIR